MPTPKRSSSKKSNTSRRQQAGSRSQSRNEKTNPEAMQSLRAAAARADQRIEDQRLLSIAAVKRRAETMGRGIAEVSSKAVEGVTGHPVPAIMIGAGLAWLLVDSVNRRTHLLNRAAANLSRSAGQLGQTLSEAAGSVGERFSEAAETVGETFTESAGRVAEYARTGASAATGALCGSASALSESAQAGYDYSRETLAETWQEHPLAVGVAVLAAGVAAGLLLPRTTREDQAMGEASDEVARIVRTAGEGLLERGKKVASAAAKATQKQARRLGLSPGQLERKAGRIVKSARTALTNAATE